MKFGVMLTLVCLMIGVAAPSGGAADESDNGLDPTNPLTRLSLKYQYQNLPPRRRTRYTTGRSEGICFSRKVQRGVGRRGSNFP
ncbi:MAG: hypothetical protein MPW15_11285 [Candidatus Manganitrophus sp.]|nr:hypothetical protein [Candidatus Manganitrophus sp.]